ncbi:hypothetical protein TOK_1421 [Pseudonocardia sp. N23]|nr:hypothetical protein TOK_1421 [Pseudonocardia sp. N23]
MLGVCLLGAAACGADAEPPLPPVTSVPVTTAPTIPPPVTSSGAPATTARPSAGTGTTAARPRPPANRPPATLRPGRSFSTELTFYSAYDNDPPGTRAIAYPGTRHSQAGGTGTFADPLTLATDPREIPVGTVVYVPTLRKYFVMEDDCEQCISDWGGSRTPHIDLYMPNGDDSSVTACQHQLTPAGRVTVELGAPAGRPVSSTPLWSGGRCSAG